MILLRFCYFMTNEYMFPLMFPHMMATPSTVFFGSQKYMCVCMYRVLLFWSPVCCRSARRAQQNELDGRKVPLYVKPKGESEKTAKYESQGRRRVSRAIFTISKMLVTRCASGAGHEAAGRH